MDHLTCVLFLMVLGHFVGDYLLQSKAMAIKKGQADVIGYLTCTVHCMLYTFVVTTVSYTFSNPYVVLMVFVSHFPIDKWSLGRVWLRLIDGRDFMKDGHEVMKARTASFEEMSIVTSFACFVYIVVDNTLHILLMWCGLLALNALKLL